MQETTMRKPNVFANIGTLAYRNLLKTLHNPERLADVIIIPIVFMVMFTYIFGGAISGNISAYLPVIVPGVLMQAVLNAASGSGSQIREDLDTGVFDRFKSLPIAHIAPLAGQLFADILRLVIAVTASILTGLALGWRPDGGIGHVIIAAGLAIFSGWAISWIFALLGLVLKSAALLQSFSMLVTMGMTFLSSAFVPIKSLPNWLQVIANINPLTHMISAIRSLLDKGVWGHEDWLVLGIGIVIVVVMAPLTLLAYNKKN
ncbi:ABC transporter permease [Periweissella cryptocerci]|uniref:Transport permease protein n=1 Tax=Periweissella cryptocerci TaxID=2506420 RepID=A0A4P6YTV7_9LACO|nr:ABC transporter permease [Periweissella cryptocerci]QBO36198.1 ABC transporter permease [Periweissella cryptocerci]